MSGSADQLRATLQRIDRRGYKAYKDIRGDWNLGDFTLHIDHVQGDPFAAPSRVRVTISADVATFPSDMYSSQSRATGLTSYLGYEAIELLLQDVPAIVASSLYRSAYSDDKLWRWIKVNEDADALRAALPEQNIIAFVADGAILPRRSGIDDRPLEGEQVIPFKTPPSLKKEIELPHAGKISGMGIPAGVTLIVGGGYHGKSTLLRAIEQGVYNHCPDDGRELVVSLPDLVKIRAEDGRSVSGVDISPFINNLPLERSTNDFSTVNASGSTSQAAATMEALEAGATGLLIDEDTAATNFMIRDSRMQALVPKNDEPITPFIDRVRQLYEQQGISSILVIGGSGDYLDVADSVIAMHTFQPQDVTEQAQAIAHQQPTGRQAEVSTTFNAERQRVLQPRSLNPQKGKRDVNIKTYGVNEIQFGRDTIDLYAVEQLVSWAQTNAIGQALWYARQHHMDGTRSLAQVLDLTMADIEREGLDVLDRRLVGDLASFRRHELAAALNRLRALKVN